MSPSTYDVQFNLEQVPAEGFTLEVRVGRTSEVCINPIHLNGNLLGHLEGAGKHGATFFKVEPAHAKQGTNVLTVESKRCLNQRRGKDDFLLKAVVYHAKIESN